MKLPSKPRWRRWLAGAVGFGAFLACAFGTSVIPPNFEQLVNESDYIVRAVVKSVTKVLSVALRATRSTLTAPTATV